MSAEQLQEALRRQGLDATIDADGAIAVMRLLRDDPRLSEPAFRRALVAMAAEHGFRNLALEVD